MNTPMAREGNLTCREFLDLLLDYVEGDTAADVKALCERHLELCRSCRDYLASYRTTARLGREAMKGDAAGALPEDLLAAILAAAGSGSHQH